MKTFVLLSLVLVASFFHRPANAALSRDSYNANTASGSTSATVAISPASTSTGLVVCIVQSLNWPATGCTYDGNAMTEIPSSAVTVSIIYSTAYYYKGTLTSGSKNVVGSISFGDAITVGAVAYSGADQTTPLGTAVTDTWFSATMSVDVSSSSGNLVLDALVWRIGESPTVGAGQTQLWNVDPSGSGALFTVASEEAGGGTTTMSWSRATSQNVLQFGIEIKSASGGGGGAEVVGAVNRRRTN